MKILAIHGINASGTHDEILSRWRAILERSAYTEFDLQLLYWGDLQTRDGKRPLDFDDYGRIAYERLPRAGRTLHDRLAGLLLWATQPMVRQIAHDLAEDVHSYFYTLGTRTHILERMRDLMMAQPDLVIAHSMGSVIAMDYFATLGLTWGDTLPSVITIGSPLGNPWILGKLNYPLYPSVVRSWLNVSGDFDPVTWPDRHIADEYCDDNEEHRIRDVDIRTPRDSRGQREPHSLYGYLMSEPVVNEVFRESMRHATLVDPGPTETKGR